MSRKAPTFETRLERLQEIVQALEAGKSSLEDSVRLYKEGLELAAACQKQLDTARHDIKIFTEKGLEPFSEEAPAREAEDEDTDEAPF